MRLLTKVVVLGLTLGVVVAAVALGSPNPSAESRPSAPPANDDFESFLKRMDAAELEILNGNPAAYKALWSHADDITISGGFGGTIEKGWEMIGRRLDWVASHYSKGDFTLDRVVKGSSGDLGYAVQLEHIRFHIPGQESESRRDYRVTMLFRREADGWRIIHRQADSNMTKQAPGDAPSKE
jgi:ketosteroid isomerase-like protein